MWKETCPRPPEFIAYRAPKWHMTLFAYKVPSFRRIWRQVPESENNCGSESKSHTKLLCSLTEKQVDFFQPLLASEWTATPAPICVRILILESGLKYKFQSPLPFLLEQEFLIYLWLDPKWCSGSSHKHYPDWPVRIFKMMKGVV